MRVVFMGTPEFALPSLRALIDGPDDIIAVITQPDRPKGRHGVLTPPPVKLLALQHSIPVYQPLKIKDKEFVATLSALKPDVIVVVAYGQILSQEILDVPGWCINIHASLLPEYRGSAPINWALIKGEKVTGVTSMIVSYALDAGPVLLKKEVAIDDNDDAKTLHDKLSKAGGELLSETMRGIADGTITPIPQDESLATYFPMLEKSDGLIDWSMKASDIRNSIRGLIPWPGAYTYLQGAMLKIQKSEVRGQRPEDGTPSPGTIVDVTGDGILVATGSDNLLIKELQAEGKRRMTADEFIRGHKIEKGMTLGS